MAWFGLWTVLSGVIDAAIAVGVLCVGGGVRRRRWPIRLGHAAAAAMATAIALCAKIVLLAVAGGLNFFGAVRLIYVDCVVVLPLAGLAVLVHRRLRPAGAAGAGATRSVTVLALLAVLAAPVGYYATFVEPYDLRIETPTVAVAALPAAAEPIVVAVLADIQTTAVGAHERRAIEAVVAARPDLILIPGDVYQGPREAFAERVGDFRALFARLSAPGGVYIVEGDIDDRGEVAAMIEGTEVRWLDDEVVEVLCRGVTVRIGGVNLAYRSRAAQAVYRGLAQGPADAVRVLMAHRPAAVSACIEAGTRPDIVLAGHTHGGQVQIPGIGPLFTASWLPRKHAAGLSRYDGVPLYVSRGIGCERGQAPRLRLFCPPEVTLLSLVPASSRPRALAAEPRPQRATQAAFDPLRSAGRAGD